MIHAEPQAEWSDATVMVVDDEPLICRMLERVLEQRGYEQVQSFTDPEEARSSYVALKPDLVLLDLHMPKLDGTALLKWIMERPSELRAPVIIMTGAGRAEDAHRTLALGAADFLHKPVDTTELLLRVRHQLRERRLRRELAEHNERLGSLVQERAGELALLSRVLDEMPLPAFVLTRDLQLHFANERGKRFLADADAEMPDVLAVTTRRRAEVAAILRGLGQQPQRIPVVVRGADGRERRTELQAQRVNGDLIALLFHDVEEQELAKETLGRALSRERESVDRMRALETLRTNFLTAVSHELRTPLTVVLGIAELLRRHGVALDEGQRSELLERLEENADRLALLLEDLLDLNRLSEQQRSVTLERSDLAELVAGVLAELADGDEHPIKVELEPCQVDVEVATMRRVVSNLVRNARVHTPAGTSIEVALRRVEDRVRLTVADRGPGVPDRLKQRIFERFEQGGSAPSHQPGTGIGLTLVRGFVALYGGEVWVEDTPGGGATFVVDLPAPS